ncbi:cytochrome P450 [Aspergillus californicus]
MALVSDRGLVLSLPWGWASMILVLLLIASYCIYYVYLHPYAKYPGPFISKFTIARTAYYSWKGDIHLDSWRCHQIYGPVVRYHPNFLIFNSAAAARDIYSMQSNVTKSSGYAGSGKITLNMVTHINKGEHAKRRKLAGPSFSFTNIKRAEHTMVSQVRKFLDALRLSTIGTTTPSSSSWGPAFDVGDWCSYLAFDVMSEFLFGVNYNLLQDESLRKVVHNIEDTHMRHYVLLHLPALFLGRMDKKVFRQAVRGSRGYLSFMDRLLKDHSNLNLAEKTNANAFSAFADAKDHAGNPLFTAKELHSEAVLLTSAGQDTTSVALRSVIFYLTRYPHAYKKLVHEISTTFEPNETISIDKAKACSYLNACITESLRLSPVIGSALYRTVGPGGATIDGVYVPEGYDVGSGMYTMHHNEDYFSQPFEFIPERWIVDENSTAEQVKQRMQACMPFSIGPRACIGKSLAQTFLQLAVASLVQRYDFRVTEGSFGQLGAGSPMGDFGRTNPKEFQLRDYIVATAEGPVVQLRERC